MDSYICPLFFNITITPYYYLQYIIISKIFKISLDELTNNDMNNVIMEKVSNTEKLAELVLRVSKYIGICFLIMLLIDIISFIIFMFIK